jgi:hypothetical protein
MKRITFLSRQRAVTTLLVSSFFLALSCTSDFDEINTDKNSISTIGPAELPFLFSRAQSQAALPFWYYQVGQNLFADQYAQYFANVTSYFPSDRLVMRPDWAQWIWTPTYTVVMPQLKTIMENTEESSAEYAIANIWWVWSFHRLTDYFGPIPYSKAGEPLVSVPYDSQEEIYNDFFARLSSAVSVLETKTSETPYGDFDLIYKGDVGSWIKFANTLRLRLALRISKVNSDKAKSEAEAAVAGGVMTTGTTDDALLTKSVKGSDTNGLAAMSDWNEFRMSASMESVLKGYEDPRLEEFFLPAVASGTYEGLRNGLTAAQLGEAENKANATSHVGSRWTASGVETPQNIISTAEAYFLKAEGALNGWNMGGTAQDFYEAGITSSLNQWGITDATVIENYKNSTSTPIAPDDYLNSPAITDVPVAFGDNESVQREQIAVQKWLALFPDGIEAWADIRRSDAFALYPVANSDNPDLTDPASQTIRRLTFLLVEKQLNEPEMARAEQLLGGPDKITTPLWWDK